MFKKIKKILKLSNWKRWTISSVSLISMILAISVGSIYSVNNKPSIDYKSGAEIVSKIETPDETIEVIKRQTEQRLKLTLSNNSEYRVTVNSNDYLKITSTNIETDKELLDFKNFVINKEEFPIVTSLNSKNTYDAFFMDATLSGESISLKLSVPFNSVTTDETILIWKDLEGLKNLAVAEFNDEWTSANVNEDPYKFLFVDGITENNDNGRNAILKTKDFGGFDALDYLISKNTVPSGGFKDSINLDFSFAPKITTTQKEKIFYNLDYSVSGYTFTNNTYNFIQPNLGSNAYQFLIIAAAVAFSFVSVFLVVNYGLLGALSTICAAFLIFLGLLMITIFRGEYTPETIAALMISIGIGLDLNIAFFERMKKELKSGNSLQKSLKKADKLTMSSSITKALSLIITSIVIYVLGSLYLGTFSSLVLILSILGVLVMFVLIRILTNLIIGTKIFDNKLKWLGIYKKIEKQESNQLNKTLENEATQEFETLASTKEEVNISSSDKKIVLTKRISLLVLSAITIVGTVLFTTFSIVGSSWLNGFNASGKITTPTVLRTKGNLDEQAVKEVNLFLNKEYGISEDEIKKLLINKEEKAYLLEISTTKTLDNSQISSIRKFLEIYNVGIIDYSIIAGNANASILNIIYIALASILAMAIFVLFRSDWTYALSMLLSLFIAFLIFIVLFTFQIFTFNTFFIFSLASIILIAISNNITILFRIKEKLKNKKMEELTKKDIKNVSDIVVKDSLRRLLISNGILMIILLIFTCLPGSISISFSIPLMIFILISLIISVVVLPFFFNAFKSFKCKRIRNKILNNYWHTQIIEEQIFPSINDIK